MKELLISSSCDEAHVNEAQQEGKFCAENRTSSTRRGEKRAGGLYSMVIRRLSNVSAECQAEKRSLVTGISLLYNLNLKRSMKDSYR